MNAQDWFGGLKDAKAKGSRNPRPAGGLYRVRVEDMTRKESTNPTNPGALWFITELTILEVLTSMPEVRNAQTGQVDYHASNPRGSRVTWMQNLSKGKMAFDNLIGFLLAFAGLENEGAISGDEWVELAWEATDDTVSAAERCGGTELIMEVKRIVTKTGRPFCPVHFHPVPDLGDALASETTPSGAA